MARRCALAWPRPCRAQCRSIRTASRMLWRRIFMKPATTSLRSTACRLSACFLPMARSCCVRFRARSAALPAERARELLAGLRTVQMERGIVHIHDFNCVKCRQALPARSQAVVARNYVRGVFSQQSKTSLAFAQQRMFPGQISHHVCDAFLGRAEIAQKQPRPTCPVLESCVRPFRFPAREGDYTPFS